MRTYAHSSDKTAALDQVDGGRRLALPRTKQEALHCYQRNSCRHVVERCMLEQFFKRAHALCWCRVFGQLIKPLLEASMEMAHSPFHRKLQATCRPLSTSASPRPASWPQSRFVPVPGARTVHTTCAAAGVREQGTAPELRPRPVKRIETQVKDIPVTSGASVLKQYLAPGKVVEFRVQDSYVLGLVTKQLPSKPGQKHVVLAVDVNGTQHTVQPSQVVVVLPGKDYTEESLQRIHAKVRPSSGCRAVRTKNASLPCPRLMHS